MTESAAGESASGGRAGVRHLTGAEARWTCDPSTLTFETTAELDAPDAMIGQERAERSLDFGVDIKSHGFNIFAAGIPGTGRTSMILDRLRDVARSQPTADDWCYVHNFDDPQRPRALRFAPGGGHVFRRQMDALVTAVQADMRRAFETDEFQNQRNGIAQEVQSERRQAFLELETRAKAAGFGLAQTPVGVRPVPMAGDEPLGSEAIAQMSAEERDQIESGRKGLEDELARTMRELRARQRDARERVEQLNCDVARSVVQPALEDLRGEYAANESVTAYLDAVESHMTEHYDTFQEEKDEPSPERGPTPRPRDRYLVYRVNVLVSRGEDDAAPLIREGHPIYSNLNGRIEQRAEFGAVFTDFTMITAGALHRANGGYLVLEAEDLLSATAAYQGLKRALRDGVIRIESVMEEAGLPSQVRLDPEPIPLELKIAMVGPPSLYYLMHEYDPDFGELFKVRAEFDTEIERNDQNIERYARFIAAKCRDEGLPHFDRGAAARVIEEGVRLAQHRDRLSTRFGDISDIVREAAHWARKRGRNPVTEEDVWASIDERVRRANLVETKMRERIAEGTIMVDVTGEAVGQANGLSVFALGAYEFGQANRITARTYPGRDGVVSIDREAKLTGPIHDKGAMILSGFMSGTFGIDGPLNLSATVVFEQSYGGIEGDSASLAELFTLISSLSGHALRQDIAVTGSVNQHGVVQAVGGVTPKIEGFFDLCRSHGLTGRQGVMFPAANVKHLTIRWDVAKAVEAGDFHLYAATTVADGIELLTGQHAGEPDLHGRYPAGTAFGDVQRRLDMFARRWFDGAPR